MTDSDPTLPNPPAGGTPPPPPPPPAGDPSLPTEAVDMQPPPADSSPVDPASAGPAPTDPVPPIEPATEGIDPILPPAAAAAGVEATTVMPATEPGMDDGIPPTDPPVDDVPIDEVPEEPVPWYKKPAAIAAMVIAVLLIGGLIAWLVLGGDDDSDDDVSPTASRLVLVTTDESGAPISREISLSVTGPAGAEESFEWLRPPTANPGESAVVSSGDNGRAAFDWQPDDTVTDPANWAATLIFSESVPPGWTPPSSGEVCVLERLEADGEPITLNVAVDGADPAVARVATYTFPKQTFLPGDSVTCELVSTSPVPGTTVVESTVVETTVVETTEATTTTTIAPTTVPPTAPPTTTPPSTTTTSIDIPPPDPGDTLWDQIQAAPSLTEFEQFVKDAGFDDELNDPTRTFTIFAPTNEAIEKARAELTAATLPVDQPALEEILLAHANDTEALVLADLLQLTSIPVLSGGPQPITAQPPTVGGANIYVQAQPASNGVLYLIDKVLTPQP
jgi:uncharacterized surface protein with fasciclin (FAS1) repeats